MHMAKSLYDFKMKSIQGKDVPLKKYRGNVLLIVNVASKCGLTPQYEKLEALHKKYAARGLKILGFPANNFGAQEPGSNAEILQFCKATYSVEFDMFAKISVKGGDIDPLYAHLTGLPKPLGGDIEWNFAKFLVDRKGNIVERFPAPMTPDDPKLIATLEKLLAQPR
jgi:glutathione peroxidase